VQAIGVAALDSLAKSLDEFAALVDAKDKQGVSSAGFAFCTIWHK